MEPCRYFVAPGAFFAFARPVMFIAALTLPSCDFNLQHERGNGSIVTKNVPVPSFDGIVIGGNYNVLLRADTAHRVVVTTDENLLDHIEISDQDGLLYIGSIKNLKSTGGIEIVIHYSTLQRVVSTGASSIRTSGSIDSDQFVLEQSGSAAFRGSFNALQLEIRVSGAGIVEAMGYAENQQVIISGAGGYQGADLHSRNCDITLSGIGGASIYVTDTLEATITGIGGILYSGQPKHIHRMVKGVGKITEDKKSES